jgi:hypothetical protein
MELEVEQDTPVDTLFHDGWFRTWHTPNCIMFTRIWPPEAAAWCDCGGYERKKVPVDRPAISAPVAPDK